MPRRKSQSHEPRSRAKCQMPKAKRPESQKRFMSYESIQWPRIMNMHIPTNTPVAKTPMEATDSIMEEAKEMVD